GVVARHATERTMSRKARRGRHYCFLTVAVAALSVLAVRAQPAIGRAPSVQILQPPAIAGEYAIWGSTGVDTSGRIFFGITSNDKIGSGSAPLVELNPATSTFRDRGDVVTELARLGLRRTNESQMKIHSRIVQAIDGYQYFSSMDETGENDDGSKLP